MSTKEVMIKDFLNGRYTSKALDGDLFGVEIEMETEGNMPGQAAGWDLKEDGSLKKINEQDQTGEWVLSQPMSAEGAKDRVKYLDSLLRKKDTVIRDTIRAGVHIHINVADLTFRQLFNFLTIYYALEDLLLDFCGHGRKGNAFARPFSCCEYTLTCFTRFLEGDHSALGSEHIRYSAMNINPLYKFGSLEFRAIRTPSDGLEVVNDWIDLFAFMKDTCKSFDGPPSILSLVSGYEASMFVNRFVEPRFAQKYINDLPASYITDSVFNNIRIWQEVAYSVEDWSKIVAPTEKKAPFKKMNLNSPSPIFPTWNTSQTYTSNMESMLFATNTPTPTED